MGNEVALTRSKNDKRLIFLCKVDLIRVPAERLRTDGVLKVLSNGVLSA